MKYCPNCGTKLPMDAGFCTSCGEKTLALKSKEKSKKTVMLISIALIAVAAIGLVLWFVLRDDSPNTAEGWLAQGERHLFAQNYEQAVVSFRKVIEIEPRNPRGYTGAADGYMGLEQPDKAADVLRQGLNILPENPAITTKLKDIIEEHEYLRVDSDPPSDTSGSQPPTQGNDDPAIIGPPPDWSIAYRDFLQESHSYHFGWTDYTGIWSIDDVRYAELIDFGNDGVPEMMLIIEWPSTGYGDNSDIKGLLIVSYNNYNVVQAYYEAYILGDIRGADSIATNIEGNNYLVLADGGGAVTGYSYTTYIDGEWELMLSIAHAHWIDDFGWEYAIINWDGDIPNYIPISKDEYDNAASNYLGIVSYLRFYDLENDVQNFFESLG